MPERSTGNVTTFIEFIQGAGSVGVDRRYAGITNLLQTFASFYVGLKIPRSSALRHIPASPAWGNQFELAINSN